MAPKQSKAVARSVRVVLSVVWCTVCCVVLATGRSDAQTDAQQSSEPDEAFDLLQPDTNTTTNLVTGKTLHSLMSPLHWGRFSVLSASSYEGYDSNVQLEKVPLGSTLTAVNALAIVSVQNARWQMNLQYHPFLWLSQKRTYKDFGSASADAETGRQISQHWRWTVADSARYSPSEQSSIEGQSFTADFAEGLTVGTPFLSTGWNLVQNSLTARVEDRYTEYSSLEFRAFQGYLRLSPLSGSSVEPLPLAQPRQELLTFGAAAEWTDRLNAWDTINFSYNYQKQSSLQDSLGDGQIQRASVGWGHLITPTFRVLAEAGPGWHTSSVAASAKSPSRVSTTLQGSLGLFKQFRKGGIALSFIRGDQFSGVVSNTFNNRLDLSVERHLGMRWSVTATASYLEQGITGGHNVTGKFASVELDYFLTRNWSLFSQGRYLDTLNVGPLFAPQKIVTLGFRWSWVPDKP